MPLPSTPRRSVLKASAWALPAVVVATASPAFAGSDEPALVFDGGTTRVDGIGDLVIDAAAVLAVGRPIAPARVTMMVSFRPDSGAPPMLFTQVWPYGWTPPRFPYDTTLTYVSGREIAATSPVSIPSALVSSVSRVGGGMFNLVFRADGYQETTASFTHTPV